MAEDFSLKLFHPVETDGLIRLGSKYDGGYVVHEASLHDADFLMSYGVGYNVVFEKDFYNYTGKPTLAFDPTLYDLSLLTGNLKKGDIIHFLRQSKNLLLWMINLGTLKKHKINFIQEGLAATDSPKYKTLAHHFKKFDLSDKKIILKIDIEGSEYAFFNDPDVYDLFNNSLQIIFELHDLRENMENVKYMMTNLLKTHSLVHIHSNNHGGTFEYADQNVPDFLELTFLLNDYLPKKLKSKNLYPIDHLDQPCNKLKPDIKLDFFY